MIKDNIIKMFYDGTNVTTLDDTDIVEKEYNFGRPLYVFKPTVINEILNDKEFGEIKIPKLNLISVLCYKHEIDTMKDDIKMEYDAIREKLREIIKNNI